MKSSKMGRRATNNSEPQPLALHQLPGQVLTKEDVEGEHWYDCMPEWPSQSDGGLRAGLGEWREVAGESLASALRAFQKNVGSDSGAASRALTKEKTIGDRIAAVTLLVQESPVHRLDELKTLLSMVQKQGRGERGIAIEAMKDLMVNSLLPDRRLVAFEDREFECGRHGLEKRHLAYALFEDELKGVYREFLGVLEECGRDNVAHFKQKAVKITFDLLVAKPESEKILLAMLANKLGDPDRKVSSTASYSLLRLIEKYHPQMRLVVVREVEQLLYRPNVTNKTQYFAVIFLNQLKFTGTDVELARKLLRIYMDMFKTCLTREKVHEHNKPAPEKLHDQFKRRQGNPKKKKKAPAAKSSTEAKESHLMGALLIGANRAFPFTKPEQDDNSYDAHYDALFEVAHAKSLGPATQALAFLLQISQSHSAQSDRFYRALYSRVGDASEAGEPKQARFLNLLLKAMKADTNPRRMKAYMKRLLQAGLNGSASFAGACAVVLSECSKGRQLGALKSYISLPEGDDDEETFVDADKEDAEIKEAECGEEDGDGKEEKSSGDDQDPRQADESPTPDFESHPERAQKYDAARRDPQYAGADRSSLWELSALCAHFHPSVSKFAKTLCVDLSNVHYESDPLKDFSLISFLDKFVYKKAKNRVAVSLYGKRSNRYNDDPVANSKEFQELVKSGKVGEDDKFFVRFFNENPNRVRDEEGRVEGEANGELGSDSEEEAFEQAMQAEMKRLGGGGGLGAIGIGEVDVGDENEIRAFEEAFKNDMVDSDDEDEVDEDFEGNVAVSGMEKADAEGDTVVALAAFEDSDDEDDDGEEGVGDLVDHVEEDENEAIKKKGERKKQSANIFAAAEEYEEAINLEAAIEKELVAENRNKPEGKHRPKSWKRKGDDRNSSRPKKRKVTKKM